MKYSHADVISGREINYVYVLNNKNIYICYEDDKIVLITEDTQDEYGNFVFEEILYRKE